MSNSSEPSPPPDPDQALVDSLEDLSGSIYVVLLSLMLIALFGRWHSRVPWVRRYFIAIAVLGVLRSIKLFVPQFSYYRPFQGQPAPELGSQAWWFMFSEWILYVSGNSCSVIAYVIILRLWHSALEIVVGALPSWPQLTLLYLVTLSLATNLVLTILLVFMPPDTINVVEAIKDMCEALTLAAAFISYWYLLQRALRQFAQLTAGRTIYVSGREIAIGEKALRKLKRIMWVSALCTLGSMYRAASLTNFVLLVLHLASESYGDNVVIVERFLFYIVSECVPPLAMWVVMMKCSRPPPGTPAAAARNQSIGGVAGAAAIGLPSPGSQPGSMGRGMRSGGSGVGGAAAAHRGKYYPVAPDNNRFIVN